MLSHETEIINKLGLHARASAKLTQLAGKYKSEVWMAKGPRRINAKSIMGVMMLAAGKGTKVTLETDGRTAGLGGFQSINPNGRWTLFIADLVPGGEAGFVSWGIEYTPVPEPAHWTAIAALGLVGWAILRRRP